MRLRMVRNFVALVALMIAAPVFGATFGTVVPVVGGVVDIVLDAPRQRLYLVGVPDQILVYSIAQRRFLSPIKTDSLPLAAAMSRDGKTLYVACYNASSVNTISLDTLAVVDKVSLPARPEGIAVGGDGRVLITTIGTGANNASNTVLLYDPTPGALRTLVALDIVPPTPAPPQLPPTAGRPILANRSYLSASADGRYIIGVNLPNTTQRAVFVYEVASATILRSRIINNLSSVLAVSPDGSKFMAGLTLFETATLTILAQQNLANAPYPIAANVNFNTQTNQGGSIFTPDGTTIYSAFNIAPTQNPPARANVSQLQISDADNLLIQTALQLPENLSGEMVITPDGANVYAISESGFVILPLGQLRQSPIATPVQTAVLLANDQCGVTSDQRRAAVQIRNDGSGRMTATAQILTTTAGAGGLGGAGGPGGGQVGGGIVIVVPGGATGGATGIPVGVPVGATGNAGTNAAVVNASPLVQNINAADGPSVAFTYNSTNRNLGSTAPTNFLIQSPEAVNIPAQVRVYQNNRDAEARGEIIPIAQGNSPSEGLVDMVYDASRRRLYIANSGLNRVDIFDERTKTLLAPIKVGQLPRSLAMSLDGGLLYVASSNSENILIVDLDRQRVVGRLNFPPIPLNGNVAIITPSVITMTQRGLLVIMNNGTLWSAVGDQLIPRNVSSIIGSSTLTAPRTMASTPNGEYSIVLAGNGTAYLYDALADDFVQARSVFAQNQLTGYYGPIAAGPRGAYYVVNGTVLNSALTPVVTPTTVVPGARPTDPTTTVTTPIPAVAALGNSQYVRLNMPVRTNANTVVSDVPSVEIVNTDTGAVARRATTLEGPLATVIGTQRQNVDGRTMVVDGTGSIAYALTTSGLSIINLDTVNATDRPTISNGGTVSLVSYTTDIPSGGLVSIYGRNLGTQAAATTTPLPRMINGVCVTLSGTALPLFFTSPGQINVQIPYEQAAGTYQLIVRDTNKKLASGTANVRVVKYAPAVLVDPTSKQAAIFDDKGRAVNKSNPTTRDRRLVIYATGLGPAKNAKLTSGDATPTSPLAPTADTVQVFFGDKRYSQAEMIVEWSGLVPGFVGLYQINIYVPGDRLRGEDIDVTIRVGGVENKQIDAVKPVVTVE